MLHVGMAALLALAGVLAQATWPYFIGVIVALGLVLYEDRLFGRAENLFVLNERVFTANMGFSVIFLATTWAGFALR
jgi:4-hydroxybenzoate polyprenyltransferase